MTDKVAFALGGLAGNNAHGAGFLQAMLDKGVKPAIISCTSGQIFWVSKYLEQGNGSKGLRAEIKHHIVNGNIDLSRINLALFGKKDVFRFAYREFASDTLLNTQKAWFNILSGQPDVMKNLSRVLPGRTLIPMFPDDFFEKISAIFNDAADIGIAFNSYDPVRGIEYVCLNETAKKLLNVKFNQKHGSQNGKYRQRTEYKRITPENVKEALWLYQYGFDEESITFDGAYFRQIMLSELVVANRIYVARPINKRWVGDLPSTHIGLEDLKTETSFNGTYAGERDKIHLINKLVEDNKKSKVKSSLLNKYQVIDLIEIEIESQEGFFDYTTEKMEIFDKAREQTTAAL